LVMFGPREVLLTSDEPVVDQFLNGRRIGPIGMSEEKDAATMAREQADIDAGHTDGGVDQDISGIVPQLQPTPGMPERMGAHRRQDRVMRILHTLPTRAQDAIIASLTPEERARYQVGVGVGATSAMTTEFRPSPHPRGADATQQFRMDIPDPDGFSGDLHGGHVADLPDSDWHDSRGQEGS
ncbi:MAG TPA: ABC transporter ATP-binding protein, partial [Pseudonocardiaceae bacterium]|nr:ABC transporter ATP-binding protein [Pseudonocardiaceae bacterium]